MAPKPKPARFEFTVGMVLAMALTILAAMTWAVAQPSLSLIYHPQLPLLYYGSRPAFCLRPRTPASRRLRPAVAQRQPTPLCSSGRRPCALRARDTYPASKMSSQGALRLLPLLTAHSTWQHLQSLEDKERRPSREASS